MGTGNDAQTGLSTSLLHGKAWDHHEATLARHIQPYCIHTMVIDDHRAMAGRDADMWADGWLTDRPGKLQAARRTR